MNNTVYVGLAVCSHASGSLNTSTFDNLSVTQPTHTFPSNQDIGSPTVAGSYSESGGHGHADRPVQRHLVRQRSMPVRLYPPERKCYDHRACCVGDQHVPLGQGRGDDSQFIERKCFQRPGGSYAHYH